MKYCNSCGQTKEYNQFSKCSRTKDGLQFKCKSCNKIDNLKFRTEKPEHHAEWQKTNINRVMEIVSNYRKANKNSLIYSIQNPNKDTYIGMTQMHFSVRKWEHLSNYKKFKAGKKGAYNLPLLHSSFDKWGVDKHTFEVIADFGKIDRKQLKWIESTFIQSFQKIGKSLNIKK